MRRPLPQHWALPHCWFLRHPPQHTNMCACITAMWVQVSPARFTVEFSNIALHLTLTRFPTCKHRVELVPFRGLEPRRLPVGRFTSF